MPCRGKSPLTKFLGGAGISVFIVIMTPFALVTGICRKIFGWRIHDWLDDRLTLEEVESRLGNTEGVLAASWKKMKKKMITGDEFWTFRSPPETWQKLRGREGVCLKRGSKILDVITTKMN